MSSKLQRLFVTPKLAPGAEIALDKDQAHYLGNVLRLKPGDKLLLFNGQDGEWLRRARRHRPQSRRKPASSTRRGRKNRGPICIICSRR